MYNQQKRLGQKLDMFWNPFQPSRRRLNERRTEKPRYSDYVSDKTVHAATRFFYRPISIGAYNAIALYVRVCACVRACELSHAEKAHLFCTLH